MDFNIEVIGAWMSIAMSALALTGVIKAHLSSGTKENREDIDELQENQENISDRLLKVENELEHLPSAKEVNELNNSILRMEGDLKALTKTSEAAERASRRVEDFLMKKGV